MKEEIVHSLLKGQSWFLLKESYADFNRTIMHILEKKQSCELIQEIVNINKKTCFTKGAVFSLY